MIQDGQTHYVYMYLNTHQVKRQRDNQCPFSTFVFCFVLLCLVHFLFLLFHFCFFFAFFSSYVFVLVCGGKLSYLLKPSSHWRSNSIPYSHTELYQALCRMIRQMYGHDSHDHNKQREGVMCTLSSVNMHSPIM